MMLSIHEFHLVLQLTSSIGTATASVDIALTNFLVTRTVCGARAFLARIHAVSLTLYIHVLLTQHCHVIVLQEVPGDAPHLRTN